MSEAQRGKPFSFSSSMLLTALTVARQFKELQTRVSLRCVLLLSQLLDEDSDGRGVCSYFLDEGIIVFPFWLQTHLKHSDT